MKRPKRLNYPNGIYGDISYTEQLNKYITYLENKNKALQLLQAGVSISLVRAKKYARHQHYLGTQLSEFVEFEDWKQD